MARPITIIVAALAIIASAVPARAQTGRDALAGRIAEILLDNYDAKPVDGPFEALAKLAGRGSYAQLLADWRARRDSLDSYVPAVNPAFAEPLRIVMRDNPEAYPGFRADLERLAKLSLLNFELCLEAVDVRYPSGSIRLDALGPSDLDAAVRAPPFAVRQRELFALEAEIKARIRDLLASPEFSMSLGFYRIVFDVLEGMRRKTIDRLLRSLAMGEEL